MFQDILDIKQFNTLLQEQDAMLGYFSTTECSVCKVLKPKVEKLVSEYFPKVALSYVEMNRLPEVSAQLRIFTAPTIVVFFAGKEYIRKNRSFSIDELKAEIERIYLRMFF